MDCLLIKVFFFFFSLALFLDVGSGLNPKVEHKSLDGRDTEINTMEVKLIRIHW